MLILLKTTLVDTGAYLSLIPGGLGFSGEREREREALGGQKGDKS